MTKINAKIIADSVDPRGHRLVSFIITFPRYILAELNTHRMLSKNSASSRAIPFEKLLKSVEEDPFIPIAWQKNHKGMQGSEYWTDNDTVTVDEGDEYERYTKIYSATEHFITEWLEARDLAVAQSYELNRLGVTKQLCNRLLEPFVWHTVLISGTEWENFFALRCSQYVYSNNGGKTEKLFRSRKDWMSFFNTTDDEEERAPQTDLQWRGANKGMADIHMMDLAEAMWDAYSESKPKELLYGEWHIPFGDNITDEELSQNLYHLGGTNEQLRVKIATARCARTSYTVVGEEKKQSLEADIKLHDKFLEQRPLHASPFEHCAKVMTDDEYQRHIHGTAQWGDSGGGFSSLHVGPETKGWCKNYRGFIQYRAMLTEENASQSLYGNEDLQPQSERV